MSSTLKQSFVLSATAASILGAGLVVAGTTSASATQTPAPAPVATTKPAPKALSAAQRQAQFRSLTIRKYGVFPLPITERAIQRYRLGKPAIREIAAAKRFAATPKARSVRACESGGNYRINTGNGYYGAYQFDFGTWLSNGGGRYARIASLAPPFAQDQIAFRTWKARGWQPWACA